MTPFLRAAATRSPQVEHSTTARMSLAYKLRRLSTGKEFVPEVDGLRFLAISPVVAIHLGQVMRSAMQFGSTTRGIEGLARFLDFGVPLFFAISGFILSRPFVLERMGQGRPVRLPQYYMRRVTRLEPPYVISLTLFFVASVLVGRFGFGQGWSHFCASLFYVHNLVYGKVSTVNGVAWSLEIEIQFYLLLPLFYFLTKRASTTKRRLVLLLGSIVLGWLYAERVRLLTGLHLDLSILAYGLFFTCGMFLSEWYCENREFFLKRSYTWDLVGIASLLSWSPWWWGDCPPAISALWNAAFVIGVFLSVFKGVLLNRVFTSTWIWAIGGMCYTIYLLHNHFFHWMVPKSAFLCIQGHYWASLAVQGAIQIPVLLAACIAYYLLIEKPCMDKYWPSRLWDWLKGKVLGRQPLAEI